MSLGLNSALSGLLANGNAISVVSDNIANVETEGYHRKRVSMTTDVRSNAIDSGVRASSIERLINKSSLEQHSKSISGYEFQSIKSNYLQQVDEIIGDDKTGLQAVMSDFMTSMSDVANMPTSEAAKTVLIQQTDSLSGQLRTLNDFLHTQKENANLQLTGAIEKVNELSGQIAEANQAILSANNTEVGAMSNILDHRDRLVNELAEYGSVNVIERDNQTVDVVFGTGLSVVAGSKSKDIVLEKSEYGNGNIDLTYNGTKVNDLMQDGMVGGLLEFRDNSFADITNNLGRMAMAMEASYNIQHRQGVTPSGATNLDFFQPYSMNARASTANTGGASMQVQFDYSGTVAAQETRIGDLKGATYEAELIAGNIQFTNLKDGSTQTFAPSPTVNIDGLEINIAGALNPGDKFLISPFESAASNLNPAVSSPTEIAQGTTPGGAHSDNTNMLEMVGVQSKTFIESGSMSIQDNYTSMVGDIGAKTHRAMNAFENADVVLNKVKFDIESISGVNMDEEAANLVKYQQAYESMTRIISASREMFSTLLGAIR